MTVADCHTQIAVKLDHSGFWQLVIAALRRLSLGPVLHIL